ncbi:MAG: hypothetical protein V2G33_01075 [bacterium JZ-2024 1]
MKDTSNLRKQVEQFLREEGYELWDLEVSGISSPNPVLRIFIEKPGGVGIEDCSYINRKIRLNNLFEDAMGGDFYLEVSSPGVDRKLTLPSHYARYTGAEIRAEMKNGKIYRGVLAEYSEGILTLKTQQSTIYIPEEEVRETRLEFPSFEGEKREWKRKQR